MIRYEQAGSVPATKPEFQIIDLASIKLDQRAQPRDHLNTEKTGEYAEAMGLGDQFPPLVVFFDGSDYWLADGFHRHYAAQGAGKTSFQCEVRSGGLRDAILYSVGANATHGYQRSNADKRRAVLRLLEDVEWSAWSDREIARQCRVGHPLVSRIRCDIAPSVTGTNSSEKAERTFTTKHGTVATMNTKAINADRQRWDEPSEPKPKPEHVPPTHSPTNMTPEAKASLDRDNANSFIANRLWDIEKFVTEVLPSPEAAADRFPGTLLHTFSAERAWAIRDWFDAFAIHFHEKREIPNVAAE